MVSFWMENDDFTRNCANHKGTENYQDEHFHGTCGLVDWNADFYYFGYLSKACQWINSQTWMKSCGYWRTLTWCTSVRLRLVYRWNFLLLLVVFDSSYTLCCYHLFLSQCYWIIPLDIFISTVILILSGFHVRDRVIEMQLCLHVKIREELIEEPFCLTLKWNWYCHGHLPLQMANLSLTASRKQRCMPSISPFSSPLFNLGSHTVRSCTCEPHESLRECVRACVNQCCVLRKKALHAVLIKATTFLPFPPSNLQNRLCF